MQLPDKVRSRLLQCAVGLFWCWNILFICSTLPLIGSVPLLLQEWWQGDVPVDYAFILLSWMVVPWLCVVWAVRRARGQPQALAFLFFAVEGPFYCLCLYRLIIMRELTPAVSHWLILMALGLTVHGWHTLVRPLPVTRIWHTVRILAATALALATLYASALILLACTPAALRGLWELLNPVNWAHMLRHGFDLFSLFIVPVTGTLLVFTAASLLAMPLCLAVLSTRAWVQAWHAGTLSRAGRVIAVFGTVVVQALLFVQINRQPQREAFTLLESPTLTAVQFQEKQSTIRAGLLNAYLGAYRYASSTGESNGLADWYHSLLGLPKDVAALPQTAFNTLAKPLLYDGANLAADAKRAADLYEQYFDTPIQRGERAAVAQALSATYNADEREAGLVNIDQRKVWVAEQSATVEAKGDRASITLDETYVNLTTSQQEIFYLFSLPESAAITGLWLGEDRDHLQPFTIASRGAAQRVYKAEVQRRVDPALLEQVGPRQYRLRAFPVPPHPRARGERITAANGTKLYLRLRYTTLASHGAWPLPVLAEKRNVAWDYRTERRCNGSACPGDRSTWWPQELPMAQRALAAQHAYRIGTTGPTIIAQPNTANAPTVAGKKIALVVDRSWSMAQHRQELLAEVKRFRQQAAGNTVSVLLSTTPVMHEKPRLVPLNALTDNMLTGFMGGGHADQLLQQAARYITEPQDLTMVLTDDGAFDLNADKNPPKHAYGMLSMVHLGGAMAPAYDDATLQSMQTSGGSAFASLQEAWEHFARAQQASAGYLMQRDGYVFTVTDDPTIPTEEAFAPIAARLWIAQGKRQTQALTLQQLDALQAVAKQHGVVTPYSSMLVLVNTQQQAALAQAEAKDDRFERAQESGTETLQKPNNPLTASMAPEPEEWLLIIVSLLTAGWMFRQRVAQSAKWLQLTLGKNPAAASP